MPARPPRLALLAALLSLTLPGVAHAQEAQVLFDQGLGEMMEGRYKLGCTLIRRSLEIDPRPGTAFTLAECYSKAGKFASAVEFYDRYLALFAALGPDQQAQQQARADISLAERTRLVGLVAWLTVNVPRSAPASLVVTHDGSPFPADLFGVPLAVDPGPHIFTTRTLDGPLTEQRVDVATSARKSVLLQVRGIPAETPDAASPYAEDTGPADGSSRSVGVTPWVYVTGGIGAAGLLTGAVTAAIAFDRHAVMKRECDLDAAKCSQKGLDAQGLIKDTLTPINLVGWSVGGAGAVATILILALDSGKSASAAVFRPIAAVQAGEAYFGVSSAF